MSLGRAVLPLLGVLAVCSAARADRVPAPPSSCPEGSEADTNHGGPYCRPAACRAGVSCGAGRSCRTLALCIETQTYGHRGGESTREHVAGPCANGSCAAPATCRRATFCATSRRTEAEPRPGEPSRAGACAINPGATALPLAALALLVGAAVLRRRRR